MAVTVVSGKQAYGVVFTHRTDSSADWGSVANDTYFYDIADDLVYYKDPNGGIWSPFDYLFYSTGTTNLNRLKIHQELIGGIGRITFEGTSGALFSIIDDKSGVLWTTSDASGNPVGYIDADWNVRFGNPFNRPFSIRYDSGTGVSYTKFVLPDYANDAAADADSNLLSGESYTTSAVDRTIKIKP